MEQFFQRSGHSTKSIWVQEPFGQHSGSWCDSWGVLCRTRGWAWWSWWVPFNVSCSMNLWCCDCMILWWKDAGCNHALCTAVFLKFIHYGAVFQLVSTGDRLKIIPQSFQTQVEAQAEAVVLTGSLHFSSMPLHAGLAGGHAPAQPFHHPLLSQGSLLRGPFPCTL